jgi:hypothetical protein
MNKYGALWNGKEVVVQADTTYQAQQLAEVEFSKVSGRRKVKGYEITVALMELDGVPYVHVAS